MKMIIRLHVNTCGMWRDIRKPVGVQYDIRYELFIPNIPDGPYCYDGVIGTCPFWRKDHSKPNQMNGYCMFLELGDYMEDEGTSLLWDQCKECGINDCD